MRIAFFGGSFDPPHKGHLAIARAARDRLNLDRVLMAPVGRQPLKRDQRPADFQDRLAMLHLVAQGEPGIEISGLDAPRADGLPNYSFETIARLRTSLGLAASAEHNATLADNATPPDVELFMLLGADSFLMMPEWHRASELMMLCGWIVASRPGFSLDVAARALPAGIAPVGEAKLHQGYTEQAIQNVSARRSVLYLLTDLREDISATVIRGALASRDKHHLPEELLPAEIVEYIRNHNLYR